MYQGIGLALGLCLALGLGLELGLCPGDIARHWGACHDNVYSFYGWYYT